MFREQGITIASILTAIGMAISALVLALTGGGGSAPVQAPKPPEKSGLKEWVKNTYNLANLAGKAAAALPGIIGSIVSWLLSTLGKTATWLAENLWALVIAVGTLFLVAAGDWLASDNQSAARPPTIPTATRAVFSSSWAVALCRFSGGSAADVPSLSAALTLVLVCEGCGSS